MVYIFLADGFEEIEALATVDILRRGGVDIKTVSVTKELVVTGAHGMPVVADISYKKLEKSPEAVILPGGMPGTLNLAASEIVEKTVKEAYAEGKIVAAICAAPTVLYGYGLLDGKKATSYPGYENEMTKCQYTENAVEIDGNIITSRGAGTAHLFAAALLEKLKDKDTAEKTLSAMQYN